jgi:uncharacterized membrane protein YgaE (UPF0421/DUF939 family)
VCVCNTYIIIIIIIVIIVIICILDIGQSGEFPAQIFYFHMVVSGTPGSQFCLRRRAREVLAGKWELGTLTQ